MTAFSPTGIEEVKNATFFVSGMIMAGYAIVGLFFFRFWKDTRDRLFAWFGLAFSILAVQRLGLLLTSETSENALWLYCLRLVAFLLILVAIIDKNRAKPNE